MCFNLVLLQYIESEVQKQNYFSFETGMKHFVDFDIPTDVLDDFYEAAEGDLPQFLSLLTVYMGTDCKSADTAELLDKTEHILVEYPADYETLYQYLSAVFYDMTCFPVGSVANRTDATYSYVDSWQFERTYGGDRVHEGCDIMATLNKRGIYPIYSATEGIVENVGWLKLGGWRIGIRSFDSKRYYYYAHLQKDTPFAPGLELGDIVQAGDLIGFMGRTGYSDKENTNNIETVHLHFGMQLVFDESQKECLSEIWIDVYDIVRLLETHRSSIRKTSEGWERVYPFVDLDVEEFKGGSL